MMQLYGHLTPENPFAAKAGTFVAFEDDPENFLQNPEDIRNKVIEITKNRTGTSSSVSRMVLIYSIGGKGVKDEVVVLNVYSSKVTDLTLIDLPGWLIKFIFCVI